MSVKRLIIVPTYNEKQNITKLIGELLCLEPKFDVLVIDDNSPDGTANQVKTLFPENKRVFLKIRDGKLGLGSAYMEGFQWALDNSYERIFTMDADFSHQPKYLPVMDDILGENELVIGSRYIDGGGVDGWPLTRRLLSKLGNIYARTVLGISIKDCTSGFMGMTRKLAEQIVNSRIKSEGYSFLIELKSIASQNGFSIKELPIIFIDRAAGVSKISKRIIFEAIFMAIRLRINKKETGGRGNRLFKFLDRYAGIPAVFILGLFTKKDKIVHGKYDRILVIKLSAMGDSILLIPALRALRQKYGSAEITVLCTKINNRIFDNCQYVDKTIVCDMSRLAKNPISVFKLFGGKKYDVAIDFDQWLRIAPLLAFLSRAKERIGFKTEGQFRHYSYSGYLLHSRKTHEVDSFIDLLGLLDIHGASNRLEFNVSEAAIASARSLFKMILMDENEPFVVIHPETPMHAKQRHWPGNKYVELGKRMTEELRLKVLVTGTNNERDANVKIVSAIGQGAKLMPPADILTIAAVISKAKAVVSGNTGIMHLACALHRPAVAIHGPTDPVKWGPKGDRCRVISAGLTCSPCLYLGFEYKCETNKCMDAVQVEDVVKGVKEVAFSS